jgi:hypothetical protein
MKKAIITLSIVGALASSAFSQGFVFLSGGASAATRISTNAAVGGVTASGYTSATAGSFYYALFASTTQSSINGSTAPIIGAPSANYVFNNLAGWTLVGLAQNTASVGRFGAVSQGSTSAGQTALNADGSLTVSGIGGGAAANIVAVGWSGNIATTLAGLEAWYAAGYQTQGWLGQSAIGNVTLGDGNLVNTPNAFGTSAGQLGGFIVGLTPTVPEPGTLALAALGGASLLLFRRKK